MTVERQRIESADGTEINVSVFDSAQPTAGLLVVHGLQSHAGWIEATGTGTHLADGGILTMAFDRRGSGRSSGDRGHASGRQDFLDDLDAARRHLSNALAQSGNPEAPIHVLANCFGTRVVLPYLLDKPDAFASVTLTSPATHMSRQGDYRPSQKLRILTAAGGHRFDTPLSDRDFVRQGPWLDWLHADDLSLRSCTASFLRAAGSLTSEMHRAVRNLEIPLLVLTARDDVLVRNGNIETTFRSQYRGPLAMHELPGDHYMDFTVAQADFRVLVAEWVAGGWASA